MRTEKDYLGKVKVPDNAYYGVFTQRALENFQLSDFSIKKEFYYSIALIKKSAAQTNWKLKKLEARKAKAIIKASEELMKGKFDKEFCLDVFQAGAGTPYNMNVNEVIEIGRAHV